MLSVLAIAIGCSSYGLRDAANSSTPDEDTGSYDQDTGTYVPEADFWWLEATVAITEGQADADQTSLLASMVSETAEGIETCTDDEIEIVTIDDEALPDDSLVTWWEIAVIAGDKCKDQPYQGFVQLGVGPMHPEIGVRLAEAGYDPSLAETLNGAYFRGKDDAIWVYGVAGTDRAYKGHGVAAKEAPLKDGDWKLDPIFSFPL